MGVRESFSGNDYKGIIMLYIIWFILGTVVGSFLNVVIYRLPQQKQFVNGRSICPKCGNQLKAKDLVPLLSFILLKGKCRYCHKNISWQYPILELVTGVLFLFIAYYHQLNVSDIMFWRNLIIVSGLIVVFMTDLKHYLLFDAVTWFLIFIAVISNLVLSVLSGNIVQSLWGFIIAGAVGALFFWLQHAFSRGRWVGTGDIYLGLLMGLLLGPQGLIVALFFAYIIGSLVSVILLLNKQKNLKSQLPFGVFLALGTFVAMFWAQNILEWYLNLLS